MAPAATESSSQLARSTGSCRAWARRHLADRLIGLCWLTKWVQLPTRIRQLPTHMQLMLTRHVSWMSNGSRVHPQPVAPASSIQGALRGSRHLFQICRSLVPESSQTDHHTDCALDTLVSQRNEQSTHLPPHHQSQHHQISIRHRPLKSHREDTVCRTLIGSTLRAAAQYCTHIGLTLALLLPQSNS